MAKRVRVASEDELADRLPRTLSAGDLNVAVVRIDDQIIAFEDRCPHRDAKLSPGPINGSTIQCPLHAWEFDLLSGNSTSGTADGLPKFEVFTTDGEVFVELPDEVAKTWDRIHRYLIRYGRLGWVERVGSVDRVPCRRGDDVVIQTARGLEAATVLAGPEALGSVPDQPPTGELVRAMTLNDRVKLAEPKTPDDEWIENAQAKLHARGEALELIDSEILFDDQTIVLYFAGTASEPLEELSGWLGDQLNCRIILHPLIESPAREGGCGKPGCGGGGCSA